MAVILETRKVWPNDGPPYSMVLTISSVGDLAAYLAKGDLTPFDTFNKGYKMSEDAARRAGFEWSDEYTYRR